MDGFLCIDKPDGMTSRDAVNIVQRVVRPLKIGHAGTLDPMATGVLVMAIGRATKLISYVQQMPKWYAAEFELGKSSDTEDVTGSITTCLVTDPPSENDVRDIAAQFVGEIMQVPPKYSALRVNGKRAHALARAGAAVKLQARPIEIYSLRVVEYAYPLLKLYVECGSGTYIRSLGRDIGHRLACGAAMSALRRTRIGNFSIQNSVAPKALDSSDAVQRHLQPMLRGVSLPTHQLTRLEQQDLRYGRKITVASPHAEIAGIDEAGDLLAILKRASKTQFRPAINFAAV